jgi:dTDP-glucose 4,6-dehydratase
MVKNILITGGCGFIGHHVVEHFFHNTDYNIFILDKLTYASRGLDRLRNAKVLDENKEPLHGNRVKVFTFDISHDISPGVIQELGDINYIIHMAADTHVDNSIKEPVNFIKNNVMSTVYMLEYAKKLKNLEKFFYFSTDEVYGSAPGTTSYKEWDRHKPTNPYSASKSCGEQICISYGNTYKLPIIIVNVMNAFGERQHVEKFIPKVIKSVLKGEKVYIHADKKCENPGSRFYIHARNIANAILFLINNGNIGEKYNIVGEKEVNNLEMALFIANEMKMELKYELVNFHEDRPGHDLRYSLDGTKLIKEGWKLPLTFEESLRKTIQWTLRNQEWLNWEEFE